MLLAGVVQLAWIVRTVKKAGVRWGLRFSLRDPDLRRIVIDDDPDDLRPGRFAVQHVDRLPPF